MSNSDSYWLEICNSISKKSKCLSRKIGCVIVKEGKFIVSTGYNGPPMGCRHCTDLDYKNELMEIFYKEELYGENWNIIDKPFMNNKLCPRKSFSFGSGEGLEYCQAAHAERNAISIAAKLGHSTDGCSIYLNDIIPCFECCKSLINAGIKEVVVTELEDYDKKGITGRYLLEQAGVKIRKFEL